MAVTFSETSKQIKLPNIALDISISGDGKLIAVALISERKKPSIQIYNTENSQLVAEFGNQFGNGYSASFISTNNLYFLVEDDQGDKKLCLANLQNNSSIEVTSYGLSEGCYSLVSDASGQLLTVLGNSIEIWDTKTQEVVRFFEGADSNRKVFADFTPDARYLYTYGIESSQIVVFDLENEERIFQLPAPQPFGQRLSLSPSGKFCLAVGDGVEGMYLYDLEHRKRIKQDEYNETTLIPGPLAFSWDSSLLIYCAIDWNADDLLTGDYIEGPRLPKGRQSAIASSHKTPIVAIAHQDATLSWINLIPR